MKWIFHQGVEAYLPLIAVVPILYFSEFFGLIFFTVSLHAETMKCPKDVPAFDPSAPDKQIGSFPKGSELEVEGPADANGMVTVRYQAAPGQTIKALSRAVDLGIAPASPPKPEPKTPPPAPKPQKAEDATKPSAAGVFEGTHTLAANLYGNPQVTTTYRIPLDANGQP